MPCTQTGSLEGDRALEADEARRDVTKLTRMLCSTLQSLDGYQISNLPQEVKDWWRKHQEIDRIRREHELVANYQAERAEKMELARLKAKYEDE